MTSEQPPRDALRPLRPLPSIDVPLLRSERSAFRSKQVARWVLLGTVVVAIGAGTLLFLELQPPRKEPGISDENALLAHQVGDPASAELPAEPPPAIEAPPQPPASAPDPQSQMVAVPPAEGRTTHTFGKALSFRDALEHNGLSRDESTALIAALTGTLDFRRSHPEDTLTFERDGTGGLQRFEYRASLTQRYEASRDSAGKWKAHQIDVPIRTQRVARGGVVVGSLGDTLEALKLGRSLAGVFSEVFEGHVNFSTDTRTGDEFRIVFDEEYVEGTFLRIGTIHAVEYKGDKAGLQRAFWHESKDEGDFFDEHGRAMHGGWLRTPLRYDHISSPFGFRMHPVLKRKLLHNGIDYAAPSGTPVRAAATGTVSFAGPKGPNGNLLVLHHAQGYESFYAHLSRFSSGLRAGTKVTQRQVIAYVGSTGRSTGPHLHFSLKRGGKFIDPGSQLNGAGLPMAANQLPDYKRRVRELTSVLSKLSAERPVSVQPSAPSDPATDLGDEEL